jgi:hypothetical protein
MLYTIALVLIILWLLGLVTSVTMGGLIHALLVIAIIAVLLRVIGGRSPSERAADERDTLHGRACGRAQAARRDRPARIGTMQVATTPETGLSGADARDRGPGVGAGRSGCPVACGCIPAGIRLLLKQ